MRNRSKTIDMLDSMEESLGHVLTHMDEASLTDEAYDVIEDMEAGGASQEDILEKVAEFIYDEETDNRATSTVASDIIDDYGLERSSQKPGKEATSGEIEDAYDDMLAEGFPEDEALRILSRRFGLTTREIEMIVS